MKPKELLFMNKIALVFIAILGLTTFITGKMTPVTTAMAGTNAINPNGSSELSLLMRQMHSHAAEARAAVAEKRNVAYPAAFLAINTAQPTDDETKNEHFEGFSKAYLQMLDNYIASTDENRIKNYNAVVYSCLSCHSSHCPGPVPKIKKLLLPEVFTD